MCVVACDVRNIFTSFIVASVNVVSCGQETDDDINSEVDLMMSSDIVVASLSTKHVTFNRLRSGWLFREDRTVFMLIYCCRHHIHRCNNK